MIGGRAAWRTAVPLCQALAPSASSTVTSTGSGGSVPIRERSTNVIRAGEKRPDAVLAGIPSAVDRLDSRNILQHVKN